MKSRFSIAHAFSALVVIAIGAAPVMAADTLSHSCPCLESLKLAEAKDAGAYLAIPAAPVIAHKQELSGTVLVQQYVSTQLKTYHITPDQYLALTPDQQRRIMQPGQAWRLSREDRHAIVAKKISVPASVTRAIAVSQPLKQDILDQYGVQLPESIGLSLPQANVEPWILGSTLVLINPADKTVVSVEKDIF